MYISKTFLEFKYQYMQEFKEYKNNKKKATLSVVLIININIKLVVVLKKTQNDLYK